MVLAVDVYYREQHAKVACVLFNWEDEIPKKVFTKEVFTVEEYISGQFYKRELPCILELLKDIGILKEIEAIIVDGHVYIDAELNYGLGGYLYKALNKRTPVIGVAKKSFRLNESTIQKVYRGKSKNPLYISSIGLDLSVASNYIKAIRGKYRIPLILKKLDQLTKED